jgi:hypothetical protein
VTETTCTPSSFMHSSTSHLTVTSTTDRYPCDELSPALLTHGELRRRKP